MSRPFSDGGLDRYLREMARQRREAEEAEKAKAQREVWGDYLYLQPQPKRDT
jgi:hypothetical protein